MTTQTYPYASTDPAVTGFISAQNGGPDQRGGGTQFAPGLMYNGIAGSSTDNVIGFSSLASSGASVISMGNGFNAVIIDGSNSTTAATSGAADNFSFTVDPTGLVTLTDTTTGKIQQVSGISYLIFGGGATGVDGNGNADYQQMYFIGGANQTEVTNLYNAAFGRHPDLGGVEYYMNQLNSGTTFQQIGTEFMNSPEFQSRFGANISDSQFVTNLYTNVLHRTPVASELAYYTAALANQEAGSVVNTTNPMLWNRAQELINFAISPENQADTGGFVINTAGAVTNGLVYSTPTPGSESAQTALNQEINTGILDTTLINVATLTSNINNGQVGLTVGGNGVLPNSGVSTGESTGTYTLSPGIPDFSGDPYYSTKSNIATYTINGSATGNSYITTPSGTINLHGTGNTIYQEGFGLQPYNPTPIITVNGFTSGDSLITATTGTPSWGQAAGTYILLTPSAASPLQGSTLKNFAFGTVNSNEYIVNVGSVGSGSAAEVAAAANKVYVPSDAFGEQIIFYGSITSGANAGGTAVFDWADVTGAPSSADSNGNHQVDANEFVGGIILVGVSSSSITTATFFHK